eukprot:CAMPEP_0194525954 /NCGR_PEP_ID=MMETSP0253-20130528/61616_1 /TAXON_ID=2966 /ORGANISM="Noctiluca scintillans" /LENGTH=135 /DNA_ID=CAMNT_0039370735 /DNA_START=173 /DNA_END=580 /DNA_ORIENTATION=+
MAPRQKIGVDVSDESCFDAARSCSPTSTETSKRIQKGDEFCVSLTKEVGDVLGMRLWQSNSECSITLAHFGLGLVQKWNEAHPDQRVSVGDKIVSVNGVRGPSSAVVMDTLLSENVLEIWFLKCASEEEDSDFSM